MGPAIRGVAGREDPRCSVNRREGEGKSRVVGSGDGVQDGLSGNAGGWRRVGRLQEPGD